MTEYRKKIAESQMGLTNKQQVSFLVIGLSPFSLLFAQQPNSINFAEHVPTIYDNCVECHGRVDCTDVVIRLRDGPSMGPCYQR